MLDRLLGSVDVVSAVNQIQLHPYFTQAASQEADAAHGILTQVWSPIGGITFYPGYDSGPGRRTLTDPEIAAAHDRSAAQVMLRWHLQEGRQVIPKSVTPSRIVENLDVFDFELTADELARVDALDTGLRSGPDPEQPNPAFATFAIPEA